MKIHLSEKLKIDTLPCFSFKCLSLFIFVISKSLWQCKNGGGGRGGEGRVMEGTGNWCQLPYLGNFFWLCIKKYSNLESVAKNVVDNLRGPNFCLLTFVANTILLYRYVKLKHMCGPQIEFFSPRLATPTIPHIPAHRRKSLYINIAKLKSLSEEAILDYLWTKITDY